jgi:hypothetical protein
MLAHRPLALQRSPPALPPALPPAPRIPLALAHPRARRKRKFDPTRLKMGAATALWVAVLAERLADLTRAVAARRASETGLARVSTQVGCHMVRAAR